MCDPLAPTAVAGLPSAMKLSPSLPSRVAVGCQWITHRAVLLVQRSLGQSLLQNGGDPESGSLVKSGENVVGSHGRRTVSQDHVEYRTRLRDRDANRRARPQVPRPGRSRRWRRGRRSCAAPSWSSARPRPRRSRAAHATASPASSAVTPSMVSRHQEASSRSARAPPELGTTSRTSRPARQGGVDVGVGAGRVQLLGERDLEVLRLARRPGRRRAGVGDPRVRVEARGVGHRDPGAEHGALEGAAEVTVAGEPEPPALGVPQPQPLDGRRLLLGLFTHVA